MGVFLLAGLCGAADKDEFPGESARWFRYQSPNFELYSAVRDGKSRQLLHRLELLRALFFDTFKMKERQPLPVTVYYFSNAKDFGVYAPVRQRQVLGGFYLDNPDRAVIAISPAWGDESARHVVFHEYVHHLNRAAGYYPPLWYNEGVAELFSTVEFKPGGVILGKHLPWHVDSLRNQGLLPLETLFSVRPDSPIYNNGKHSGRFYAQSWALLHYLQYGENELEPSRVEEFRAAILAEPPEADPASRRQVFKATLGLDYPEMQQRLALYSRKGTFYSFKARLPQIPDAVTYTRRAMTREEIALGLAELSLRVNKSADARLRLLNLVEHYPANFRGWEVLGSDAWRNGDADVAQARWHRALDAGSANPALCHELGRWESRRWFEKIDFDFRLPAPRARELRALLKQSIECSPDQLDGYEWLAWVEASVNDPDRANLDVVQAHFNTAQPRARTVLAFALARARTGNSWAALALLDQLDQMKPEYSVASAAEVVRAKLENRAPRALVVPPPAQATGQRWSIELPEFSR